MKKILLALIIIIVAFLLLIFQAPAVTSSIEKIIGMDWLTDSIRGFKSTVDTVSTNIPTKEDLVNTYNQLSSGAIEWTQQVVETVNETKAKIDEVRETLSGAQETIDKTIQVANDLQKTVQEGKEIVNDLQKISQDVNQTIKK